MTTKKAKKLLVAYLDESGILFDRVTAKTVKFSNLARCSCIFVTIHGWKPSPLATDIRMFAQRHDFYVEFERGV